MGLGSGARSEDPKTERTFFDDVWWGLNGIALTGLAVGECEAVLTHAEDQGAIAKDDVFGIVVAVDGHGNSVDVSALSTRRLIDWETKHELIRDTHIRFPNVHSRKKLLV